MRRDETRRTLDSRVLTSILSLDFFCRISFFYVQAALFFIFHLVFVMFCMLDTIRRRVLTALCILKCSMAFILSAL